MVVRAAIADNRDEVRPTQMRNASLPAPGLLAPGLIALSLLALAACSPPIPDSGASALPPAPVATPERSAASTAAAALGMADPSMPATAAPMAPATAGAAPLSAMSPDAATGDIPAADPGNVAISDEQSFAAVSARETIASDAQRIDQNRAQYVTIQPTDLPPRPDGSGASIVAYALATTNVPGQALYRRSGIAAQIRFDRACTKYPSPDEAQEAFLDAGGPQRDRLGMDPDGDGFACYWDPRPFRAARGGAPAVVDHYEVVETPGEG